MILRTLLALLALLALPRAALANDLEGGWAFRIDDATIFTFTIERGEDGGWQGYWTRPESFRSNGVVFTQLTGSEELEAMAAIDFAGNIELSFEDPRPNAVPDIFRFRLLTENQAELTYVGTDFAPYPLIRVAPHSDVGPFEAARVYDRDNAVSEADYDPAPSEAESAMPEAASQDAAESPPEAVNDESPRIGADFLDDL